MAPLELRPLGMSSCGTRWLINIAIEKRAIESSLTLNMVMFHYVMLVYQRHPEGITSIELLNMFCILDGLIHIPDMCMANNEHSRISNNEFTLLVLGFTHR